MKNILGTFIYLMLLMPMTAQSTADKNCPALPAHSGIQWTFQRGPDFNLCYATDTKTGKDLFGIYFGVYPQFNPKGAKAIGSGVIAGKQVKWYGPGPGVKDKHFSQQTIVKLTDGGLMHVWVSADTRAAKERALAALALMHLRF